MRENINFCKCDHIRDEFYFVLVCSAFTIVLRAQNIPKKYYTVTFHIHVLQFTFLYSLQILNVLNTFLFIHLLLLTANACLGPIYLL
jgi:hypothetical protein